MAVRGVLVVGDGLGGHREGEEEGRGLYVRCKSDEDFLVAQGPLGCGCGGLIFAYAERFGGPGSRTVDQWFAGLVLRWREDKAQ